MRKIKFEAAIIERLRDLSQNHQHQLVRRKALALLLKSQDLPHYKIAGIIGMSINTLRNYLDEYMKGGIDSIEKINLKRRKARLVRHKEAIKKYIKETPPATLMQACKEIGELTGVTIGKTQMRLFLKSIDVSFRKVGSIPAKADVKQQKIFLETELEPRLEEAKAGKRDVFFFR